MRDLDRRSREQLLVGEAHQLAERLVDLDPIAVDIAQSDADRGAFEGCAEADLRLAQLRCLLRERQQHRDLGAQHLRVDRLDDVVDGTGRIAALDLLAVRIRPREEHDRRVLVPRPLLDQLDGLEAVHAGHPDVHDDHPEVLVEERPQRLLAGAGRHDLMVERRQQGLERRQGVRLVVDYQDAGLITHRWSQTRISDSS